MRTHVCRGVHIDGLPYFLNHGAPRARLWRTQSSAVKRPDPTRSVRNSVAASLRLRINKDMMKDMIMEKALVFRQMISFSFMITVIACLMS